MVFTEIKTAYLVRSQLRPAFAEKEALRIFAEMILPKVYL
jgi:hypothetical protein